MFRCVELQWTERCGGSEWGNGRLGVGRGRGGTKAVQPVVHVRLGEADDGTRE